MPFLFSAGFSRAPRACHGYQGYCHHSWRLALAYCSLGYPVWGYLELWLSQPRPTGIAIFA